MALLLNNCILRHIASPPSTSGLKEATVSSLGNLGVGTECNMSSHPRHTEDQR